MSWDIFLDLLLIPSFWCLGIYISKFRYWRSMCSWPRTLTLGRYLFILSNSFILCFFTWKVIKPGIFLGYILYVCVAYSVTYFLVYKFYMFRLNFAATKVYKHYNMYTKMLDAMPQGRAKGKKLALLLNVKLRFKRRRVHKWLGRLRHVVGSELPIDYGDI